MITQGELDVIRTGSLDEVNQVLTNMKFKIAEEVLLQLPFTVLNLLNYNKTMVEVSKDFYKQNPHLEEHKDLVAKVIRAVESENPGKDINLILQQAKEKVEQQLRG